MMNLYKEARAIAQEAWAESEHDEDTAREYLRESCDGHEVTIYYGKAIEFCAAHNTDEGESWLEEMGGICQPGDSFGAIACRIAFATLLCAAESALAELIEEHEELEDA